MDIKLKKIAPNEIDLLKNEMKKSFTQGVIDRFKKSIRSPDSVRQRHHKSVK